MLQQQFLNWYLLENVQGGSKIIRNVAKIRENIWKLLKDVAHNKSIEWIGKVHTSYHKNIEKKD